jgi:hypothetical protein
LNGIIQELYSTPPLALLTPSSFLLELDLFSLFTVSSKKILKGIHQMFLIGIQIVVDAQTGGGEGELRTREGRSLLVSLLFLSSALISRATEIEFEIRILKGCKSFNPQADHL